jgi:hypothetical protein
VGVSCRGHSGDVRQHVAGPRAAGKSAAILFPDARNAQYRAAISPHIRPRLLHQVVSCRTRARVVIYRKVREELALGLGVGC